MFVILLFFVYVQNINMSIIYLTCHTSPPIKKVMEKAQKELYQIV